MIKRIFKFGMYFLTILIMSFILSILGLKFHLLFIVFVYLFSSYLVFKNRKLLKYSEIKKMFPYYLGIPLFGGLDAFSTYLFVIKDGIEREGNLVIRLIYSYLGNYTFILLPFLYLSIMILPFLYLLTKFGVDENKRLVRIFYVMMVFIFLFNIF